MSKVVKGVVGAAIGYATGGPAGAVMGGIGGLTSADAGKAAKQATGAELAGISNAQQLQKLIYDQTRTDLLPYQQLGGRAGSLYESILMGVPLQQSALYGVGFDKGIAPKVQTPDEIKQALGTGATQAQIDSELARQQGLLDRYNQPNASGMGSYGMAGGQGGTGTGGQYDAFFNSPDYQFTLQQGMKGIGNQASAGGALSGKQTMAAQRFGQGLASTQYNNYMSKLQGLMNNGQSAANQSGASGQNYATSAGNLMTQYGQTQAQGIGAQYNAGLGQSAGLGALSSVLGRSGGVGGMSSVWQNPDTGQYVNSGGGMLGNLGASLNNTFGSFF